MSGSSIHVGPVREVWFHALGARVGGGITYLHAVAPRLATRLAARGIKMVLLLPGPMEIPGLAADTSVERREFASLAGRPLARAWFDRVTLPRMLAQRTGAALFCSGSMGPARAGVRTVVLVRNALWFDREHLASEAARPRMRLLVERRLVLATAAGAAEVQVPSATLRDAMVAAAPSLAGRVHVNPYGLPDWVGPEGLPLSPAHPEGSPRSGIGSAGTDCEVPTPVPSPPGRAPTFLYVLTYTLHKNLTFLLRALAMARAARVPVRVLVTTDLSNPPVRSAGNDRRILEAHRLVEEGWLVPAGTVRGEALARLYAEVDGCVFPSLAESFGHPLVEALRARRPLLCSDLPYAREIAGDHALYFDPHRPETLVDLWKGWPEAARNLPPVDPVALEARFSWDRHADAVVAGLLGG